MVHPITRDEAAWLVIRMSGLVFGWLALTKIIAVVYATYLLTSQGLREIRQMVGSTLSWEIAWPQAFQFVIYGLVSFYLLRYGNGIHCLICSRARMPAKKSDEAP